MIKRAQQWITILKNKQASSLHDDSDDGGSAVDIFRDVESMWPGAVELLNNGSWLERDAQSDFVRTKENEIAYYGALALRRAALAATECFRLETEEEQTHLPVVKRSHIGDEMLRESIDRSVSLIDGPASFREHPDWREEQLLKLLKIVQKHRVDIRSSSESGCARCDEKKGEEERSEAVSMLRTSAKTTPDTAKARVDPSRSFQSTGLASRNARESSAAEKSDELIGTVASESMVSVKGSEIHGWGLYADCRFTSGDIVAEYIGEYISNAIANVREKYYRKQRIQDYQFRVNENVVIDATLKGGYARYINHSCQPNCVARILEGEPPNVHLMRVMIIAKKHIEAGDELTYDYHFPLETDLADRVPCNCGSKHCRG
jgi:histone-lysine N-methyltransferase SETD1